MATIITILATLEYYYVCTEYIWHHQASRHSGRPTTPQGPRGSRDRWLYDRLYRTGSYKELESFSFHSYSALLLLHYSYYYYFICYHYNHNNHNYTTTTTKCLPSFALPSALSPSTVLNKQPVPPASSPDLVSSQPSCCLLSLQL